MNTGIIHFAKQTSSMLYNLSCREEGKKIDTAYNNLDVAIRDLKGLKWDDLCAIEDDKELITHQHNIIECYAKLKQILLEAYRDLFQEIKKF